MQLVAFRGMICIFPEMHDCMLCAHMPAKYSQITLCLFLLLSYSYARTLYCDVSGRESRLPLRVRGEGIGPLVQFSFDKLDIGSVFVNSEHSYEVSTK